MQTTTGQKVFCIGAMTLFVFAISARSTVEASSAPKSTFTAIDTACGAPQPCGLVSKPVSTKIVASWYGKQFQGRLTSSGEIFDLKKLTAASKTLPIGTLIVLTSRATGRTVVVRINDRGPFIRGRDLDLSEAAATKLGIHEMGVAGLEAAVIN